MNESKVTDIWQQCAEELLEFIKIENNLQSTEEILKWIELQDRETLQKTLPEHFKVSPQNFSSIYYLLVSNLKKELGMAMPNDGWDDIIYR